MRRAKGFTLVELLVVIGIIALLISILLPSLARARQAALVVTDLSNLRQVYSGFLFYANDNNGFLPQGGGGAEYINRPANVWTLTISRTLGVDQTKAPRRQARVMFSAAGNTEPNHISWYGWVWNNLDERASWIGHPILLPASTTWAPRGNNFERLRLQKLSSIKDSAGVMLAWDGGTTSNMNWNAYYPSAITLDNWAINNGGHNFQIPPADGTTDLNRLCGNGVGASTVAQIQANNQDRVSGASTYECSMRYRHNNNTTGVFLFADGHAESRKIGEVTVRDICLRK